jgi:hypothetical protein
MNFVCVRECTLFVYTDGPFAIHYVGDAGKEITPEEALKKKYANLWCAMSAAWQGGRSTYWHPGWLLD